MTQGSLGIAEAEEPHHTFIENALAKARHAAAASGLPAWPTTRACAWTRWAVQPGVASAHFAPAVAVSGDREALRRAQDAANNALLLRACRAWPTGARPFVSTLVAVRHAADDPSRWSPVGRWVGQILQQPSGQGGFGYDPLMFIPALGADVAELDAAVKNRHSHRALAAAQMRQRLQQDWALG